MYFKCHCNSVILFSLLESISLFSYFLTFTEIEHTCEVPEADQSGILAFCGFPSNSQPLLWFCSSYTVYLMVAGIPEVHPIRSPSGQKGVSRVTGPSPRASRGRGPIPSEGVDVARVDGRERTEDGTVAMRVMGQRFARGVPAASLAPRCASETSRCINRARAGTWRSQGGAPGLRAPVRWAARGLPPRGGGSRCGRATTKWW